MAALFTELGMFGEAFGEDTPGRSSPIVLPSRLQAAFEARLVRLVGYDADGARLQTRAAHFAPAPARASTRAMSYMWTSSAPWIVVMGCSSEN